MAELYANTWISQYGDDPNEPGQWLDTLAELKRLPDNWKELLRRHYPKWPPNPMQFYNCMTEYGSLNGLPPLTEAWEVAMMLWAGYPRRIAYKDVHPMFFHISAKGWIDTFGFRNATTDELKRDYKKAFKDAYAKCIEHAQLGFAFEEWVERDLLEDKTREPLSREDAKKRLAQMRKDTGI